VRTRGPHAQIDGIPGPAAARTRDWAGRLPDAKRGKTPGAGPDAHSIPKSSAGGKALRLGGKERWTLPTPRLGQVPSGFRAVAQAGRLLDNYRDFLSGYTTSSTRRLRCLPANVALETTGWLAP